MGYSTESSSSSLSSIPFIFFASGIFKAKEPRPESEAEPIIVPILLKGDEGIGGVTVVPILVKTDGGFGGPTIVYILVIATGAGLGGGNNFIEGALDFEFYFIIEFLDLSSSVGVTGDLGV